MKKSRIILFLLSAIATLFTGAGCASGGGTVKYGGYERSDYMTYIPKGHKNDDVPGNSNIHKEVLKDRDKGLFGVSDYDGNVVQKPVYKELFIAGASLVFGKKPDAETWEKIDIINKTVTNTPYYQLWWAASLEYRPVVYAMTKKPVGATFEVDLLNKLGNPVARGLKVGGKNLGQDDWVLQAGNVVIFNYDTESGEAMSSLVQTDGISLGAPIKRVGLHKVNITATEAVEEMASSLGLVEHPDTLSAYTWQPLYSNGAPIPLPPEAIGMTPIYKTYEKGKESILGWVIIYKKPQGSYYFKFGNGYASAVIAAEKNLKKYAGFYHAGEKSDSFYAKNFETKSWEVLSNDGLKPWVLAPKGIVWTTHDALKHWNEQAAKNLAAWNAEQAAFKKQQEENDRLAAERVKNAPAEYRKARTETFYQAMADNRGNFCFEIADELGDAKLLAAASKKFGVRNLLDVQILRNARAMPDSELDRWQALFEKQIADKARSEQLTEDDIAMIQHKQFIQAMDNRAKNGGPNPAAKASMDKFNQQQWNTYQQNLDNYNSGSQNWKQKEPGK